VASTYRIEVRAFVRSPYFVAPFAGRRYVGGAVARNWLVRSTELRLFESPPDRQTRRGQAGGTSGALLRRAHLYGCRDRIPVSLPELRESYKGITSRFQRDDRISSIRSRSNHGAIL
jgi:hypothetical protein